MLSFRQYTPNDLDRTLTGQLSSSATTVHHDWLEMASPSIFVVGETRSPELEYVRFRTYGIRAAASRPPGRIVGSRLLYYSTQGGGSGRLHHVRMMIDPVETTRWNPCRTQLVQFVFALVAGGEETHALPNIAQVDLQNAQDTWCGHGSVRTMSGDEHPVFWRLLSSSPPQAHHVDFDAGRCVCDIPFATHFVLRHRRWSRYILVRVMPLCSIEQPEQSDGMFVVSTLGKTLRFASLLYFYEEPQDARLVLDPFFASPFSQWLLYCSNHCLRWRVEHDDIASTQRFVDAFFAVTREHTGDALQHRLQQVFPLERLGDLTQIPLVASNPPFFFNRRMFENLFTARDVVVLCSETPRTNQVMQSLEMQALTEPQPSAEFVFFRDQVLRSSRPNVRVALRYWVKSTNPLLSRKRSRTSVEAVRVDPLLNEHLIDAIEADGFAEFRMDARAQAMHLERPHPSTIDAVRAMETKCLHKLVASLVDDRTRTMRVYKLAALYFVHLKAPEIVAAYTLGAMIWADVQMMAASYWSTIDFVVRSYPELIRIHFETIAKQPDALRIRSLVFFTLGIPNVEALEEHITSPDQVDAALYEPIRKWYACLEEVDAWLSEPVAKEDRRDLMGGIARLHTSL